MRSYNQPSSAITSSELSDEPEPIGASRGNGVARVRGEKRGLGDPSERAANGLFFQPGQPAGTVVAEARRLKFPLCLHG